jgi:uncharacterized YccA/Bax inhibitor family protein
MSDEGSGAGAPEQQPPHLQPPQQQPPMNRPPVQQRPTGPFNPPPPTERGGRLGGGSWGVRQGFARMPAEFGTVPTSRGTTTVLPGSDGPGYGAPGGPGTVAGDGMPPVSDVRPLVANEVYNKVAVLSAIALLAGAVGFFLPISPTIMVLCVLAAAGIGFWGIFAPHKAKVLAPVYAVLEGLALGVISRYYNDVSHGIVPIAVVGTAAIFLATLAVYRAGWVKVTNRFIMVTVVMGFGLLAAALVAILGVQIPGLGAHGTTFVVFGVLYLVVAVLDLFVDFELVNRAASAGISAEAEWYGAFVIMFAVVMVYLALLRILAGGRR